MKQFFTSIFAALFLMTSAIAQNIPSPTIAAKSWMLVDASSNQVIASGNPDERVEPASLTKLMTAYLVFQALKDKRLDAQQKILVSETAWRVDPSSSKMFIEPNKPVTVDELLKGLIIVSGNDAAVALAEAVSGTTESFAALMNQEAQRLGMTGSHFSNPHGLPSPDTYTTAHDLAILCRSLIVNFPEYYKAYYSQKEYTYNGIRQPNRNRLLWSDPTVDGMKTGHTSSAGYSLITSAERPSANNGRHRLISIIVGTNSDLVRTQESQKLLNWGFLNFDAVKLYDKNQAIETASVWKGSSSKVKVGFEYDFYVTVPKGAANRIKTVLERNDPIIAPVTQGQKIGTLKISLDDNVISEQPVVALESISVAGFIGRAWDSFLLLFK